MRKLVPAIAVALLATFAAPVLALDSGISPSGLPSASSYSSTLLPELSGVVSWKTLSQVEPDIQNQRMVPKFSDAILALDRKLVRVQGFMLPLDLGNQQRHFLLSAVPPHCQFCMPAGPEALVEVTAKKSVAYGIEPMIITGKFALVKSDPSGILYRLTEAEPVTLSAKLP